MKTVRNCFILALTLWTCSAFAVAQGEPDGDDERPELTPEEVQTFLKQHLPEAIVLLEDIRRQEPMDHYQAAMREAAEVVEAYHQTISDGGKEAADRELRWHRIELQMEKLELEWRRASDEASRLKAREALRSKVVERFDSFLKTFHVMRLMGEFAVARHQFDLSMREEWYAKGLAARTKMARLFEEMVRLHLEKATNASDLGEIVNLEILNWHQLVVLNWDKQLAQSLGKPTPDSANPSPVYDGAPLIRLLGTETHIAKGQRLELSVIALGTGDTPPVLKVRTLGRGA